MCNHHHLCYNLEDYMKFFMNESSPAIQASISSTVRGTMVILSAPSSVTITLSSILTPPVPRNSFIFSATKNLE